MKRSEPQPVSAEPDERTGLLNEHIRDPGAEQTHTANSTSNRASRFTDIATILLLIFLYFLQGIPDGKFPLLLV